MKHILIIVLLSMATLVQAQSPYSRLETRISDDNQALLIQIDANKQGREVHYKRAFDVSGMNGLQIDALKYRVFASQGVTLPIGEMKRLASAALVVFILLLLVISFLIVRYQARKSAHQNLERSLRID